MEREIEKNIRGAKENRRGPERTGEKGRKGTRRRMIWTDIWKWR